MTGIPLRLGPLRADGYTIRRSGVRWLVEPGQQCGANQLVAYFNIELARVGGDSARAMPFEDERDLYVACALQAGGRLRFDPAAAPGGYLSTLGFNLWDAGDVLAHLDTGEQSGNSNGDAGELRLLLLAGRRMTQVADVRAGLLSGWHGLTRGWWCNGAPPLTLLSLGICDVTGVILGEDAAFLELFGAEAAASQFVFVPDHPLAPAAPVLLDQLQRSPAQFRAIATDLQAGLSKAGAVPTADDWMFAGSMVSMMERNPIRQSHDILSPSGLTRSGPAEAVLLSLSAEPPTILRHKKLGYHVHFLPHHQRAVGPAIRRWLAAAFEPVARSIDDIKNDYVHLVDAIEAATGALVIVVNRMSTSGEEDISTYAPFDVPMSATLANIAAKELNLMLHDVSAGRNVAIVDVDAIAADIGGRAHLPDGIHQSKTMQDLLRAEILHLLHGLRPPD